MSQARKDALYCSFCGKSQNEVKKLIAGPTVYICNECVELCMGIIRESGLVQEETPPLNLMEAVLAGLMEQLKPLRELSLPTGDPLIESVTIIARSFVGSLTHNEKRVVFGGIVRSFTLEGDLLTVFPGDTLLVWAMCVESFSYQSGSSCWVMNFKDGSSLECELILVPRTPSAI